jgi:hypothetical protein
MKGAALLAVALLLGCVDEKWEAFKRAHGGCAFVESVNCTTVMALVSADPIIYAPQTYCDARYRCGDGTEVIR